MAIVPCATCKYVLAAARQCTASACATSTTDWFSGNGVASYLSIDIARAADGPCGPDAVLWEARDQPTSLPGWNP